MKSQKQLENYNRPIERQLPYLYYLRLGGCTEKYDMETAKRINRFFEELEIKREYDKFTTFGTTNNNLVVAHDLKLFSFCEHHLLPFFGIVNIGYIPNSRIIGLSKFQRMVDKISSKPTVQEELTEELGSFVVRKVDSPHVIVQVKAIHTCVIARGTESTNSQFTTTFINGSFKELPLRNEFYQTLNSNDKLRIF